MKAFLTIVGALMTLFALMSYVTLPLIVIKSIIDLLVKEAEHGRT